MENTKLGVCPNCFSKKLRAYGIYHYGEVKRQKWLCEKCGYVSAFPLRRKPQFHTGALLAAIQSELAKWERIKATEPKKSYNSYKEACGAIKALRALQVVKEQ